MKYKLDAYEQELEDNFEQMIECNDKEEYERIMQAAKEHVARKKSITIRLTEHDIEAMKFKASKRGIPYQTYINMLIHLDAAKL
ncbi:CopG family antitoxin [Rickettsia endosymbiont of Halotydeus destructor]|uniref:CopG family antitoxin n=1 Tax=Rickettsia endosymbiont of Halotydeus destructor TaxID=2996754 RepID=UPI003BAEDB8F